ncbi:MAG: hypothetical protein ABFC96_11575 [Thermoguttaceae bacterium]
MTGDRMMVQWLVNLRTRGLITRGIVLAAAVLALLAVVAPVAWRLSGAVGVAAAAAAAGACLAGAASALALSGLFRQQRQAAALMVTGIAARMGLPLALALAIQFRGGPLAEAGLLYYLVVFYPAALTAEIAMSLPIAGSAVTPRTDPPTADEG